MNKRLNLSGEKMSKVIVVGGGPSGIIAAIAAAEMGHAVEIYEKNEKLGKKLYITGKGRCNITNASEKDIFFEQLCSNKKFFYSSFNKFNNIDTINFFNNIGLKTKRERANRIFPLSNKSSDVISVLNKHLKLLKVKINYNTEVKSILIEDNIVKGIKIMNESKLSDSVIIATGGLSYPLTGSTGDGYRFAKDIGHKVTELSPSLVPIHVKEEYIKDLMGLSLKNINIKIFANNKKIYEEFGELIFTHFGLSGPLILSGSSYIVPYINKTDHIKISIDLKPALTQEQLDNRILRDFDEAKNKDFKNSLDKLLPTKLIQTIVNLSEINADKKVNEITKIERNNLVNLLKNLTFTITKLADYNQAIITKGGVNIREINPSTMESKIIKNLYFVGEVLDLDALTGGYNLQIAWSTGHLAGSSIE